MPPSAFARLCQRIQGHPAFRPIMVAVIVVASLLVGLQTYEGIYQRHSDFFKISDAIILGIFCLEIAIRVGAYGRKPWRYFADGWNVFDFAIVLFCFLPMQGSGFAAVLRMFRVLRVLRLFSALPKLQMLVTALLHSLPSMVYVLLMMGILFYVYAAMGTVLFRLNDPVHFGTLGRSGLSLFGAITLEDWPDLMYTQFYGSDFYGYNNSNMLILENKLGLVRVHTPQPIATVLYFGSFILIGGMVIINLFVGVILNGINEVKAELEAKAWAKTQQQERLSLYEEVLSVSHKIDELQQQLAGLQQRLKKDGEAQRGRRQAED
jgi:voltage-gated sodium channel